MLSRYLELLRLPGALRFSIFGLIGRFPMTMMAISTILMVRLLYGNYTLAGSLSAASTIAYAVGAPVLARLVDRYGQARVMIPSLTISILAAAAMIVAALQLASPVIIAVCAVVSGATSGSIGAMARTRWPRLVTSPSQIQTAYALEAAIDEVCFMLGPIIATAMATAVHPVGGLALMLVFAVVGGYGFLLQRSTEPAPIVRKKSAPNEASNVASSPAIQSPAAQAQSTRVITPALIVLAITYMGAGLLFGVNDITVVAFADEQGYTSLSGLLLAFMAAGSLVAALFYGAKNWAIPMWKRFIGGIIFLAIGVTTFFFAHNMVIMAVVLLITGLAVAPTMTNVNTIVEMVTPKERLTESLTWLSTAMCIGIAIGSGAAGSPVDNYGSHAGFLLVIVAGWLMALVALAGLRLVRREIDKAQRRQVSETLD